MEVFGHRCEKCSAVLHIPVEAIQPDKSYQKGSCGICRNPMAGGVLPRRIVG